MPMSSPVRARLRDWGPVALEQLLTVVWLGSLWTVGYLVAPVLFATLPERALAGPRHPCSWIAVRHERFFRCHSD